MIFTIWPGILRDTVLSTTLEPDEIFASTSATGELQLAADSSFELSDPKEGGGASDGGLGCTNTGVGLGPGLGLRLFLLFLDSNDCRTWCSSLMNSITPPIIDAWSPFHVIYMEY